MSLPRRDSKVGPGHRGIAVAGDPDLSIEEAARRRDFTINAMLFDPFTGEVLDPHGGRRDLAARVLRAVDAATLRRGPAARAAGGAARGALRADRRAGDRGALRGHAAGRAARGARLRRDREAAAARRRRPSIGFAFMREWGMLRRGGARAAAARRHAAGSGVASGGRRLDPHPAGRSTRRRASSRTSTGRARSP